MDKGREVVRRRSGDAISKELAFASFISKDGCEVNRKEFWDGLNALKEIQTKDHILLHQLLDAEKSKAIDDHIQWEKRRKKLNKDNAVITTAVVGLITALAYLITLAANHFFG